MFESIKFRGQWRGIMFALLLVALMTIILVGPVQATGLRNVTIVYLIPVLLVATRWGIASAVVAAVAGVVASAYFFYPPLFDLRVKDPQQIVDLLLFVIVAIVTGQLATNLKRQAETARQRENAMRDLYAFSRRLARAFAASEIRAAIQDHLTAILQRKVVLFESVSTGKISDREKIAVPGRVRAQVEKTAAGCDAEAAHATLVDDDNDVWLVRAVSPKTPEFGIIAINVGTQSRDSLDAFRAHVDAALTDATATLERLDVARALNEARMRAETEVLRDALIGSVSHDLRTPLSSILGAATVLATAPVVATESRLASLVRVIREEAERLNDDIQKLLDATRISSLGVRPRSEWTDPADIVNAALEHCHRRIGHHKIEIDIAADLPLIYVDAVLVGQALAQILDNALKYSPGDSKIDIAVRARDRGISFSVTDRGPGLTEEDKRRMWDRFYRGERHSSSTSGSGLGLWIAQSFVTANGGRLEAVSDSENRGATISIEFPFAKTAVPKLENVGD